MEEEEVGLALLFYGGRRKMSLLLSPVATVLLMLFLLFPFASPLSEEGVSFHLLSSSQFTQAFMAIKASLGNIPPDVDVHNDDYFCSWRGFFFDNVSLTVQSLNLSSMNLGGEVSLAIGDLVKLQSIDLQGNTLTGQIPYEIGNCAELLHLDLSDNQLYGDVPFSISKLKQLEFLNLLTGPVPSTLTQIPNLKTLSLQGNRLTGKIPEVIGLMQALAILYLHGNMLTGPIPPELGNMSKLSYLQLNDNQLVGKTPDEIGKLERLFELNLTLGVLLLLVTTIVVIYRSSQSKQLMKGTGRIGQQGILIICFMLLTVQSNGQFQFDYFTLALQWTTATCFIKTNCNQTTYSQFPQAFTIHGLWPSTYSYPQPEWCRSLLYNPNDPQFVAVKDQVSANWPDLFLPTNDVFWETEFLKHGSCMTSNQASYFRTALNLKSQIIPDVKTAIGYAPDNLIKRNYQDIINSLRTAYGVYPQVVCRRSHRYVLAEVRLCFDKVTWRRRNCPRNLQKSCDNDIYLRA